MEWLIGIGLFVGICVVLYFFVYKKREAKKDPLLPRFEVAPSPAGAKVYKNGGAVSAEIYAAIDRGQAAAFAKARARGWVNGISPSDYKVGLMPNSAAAGQTPSYLIQKREKNLVVLGADGSAIGAPQVSYDNGPFDLNPEPGVIAIRVVGQFGIEHKSGSSAYTVQIRPEDLPNYWNRLRVVEDPAMTEIAVYNETEHALALRNDPELYERTRVHAEGAGHPIL